MCTWDKHFQVERDGVTPDSQPARAWSLGGPAIGFAQPLPLPPVPTAGRSAILPAIGSHGPSQINLVVALRTWWRPYYTHTLAFTASRSLTTDDLPSIR